MQDSLQQAISAVYAAFAAVPRPVKIETCRCCVDDRQVRVLLTRELRQIAPEELQPYTSAVFLTSGDVADFRYFLPRIMEILLSSPWPWPSAEIVGRALVNAEWLM